ncbi:MAG: hypothetical protein O3A95_05570 [Planctomycetota bacterium]|nr:hypothetical protein [Planctomycetota bacterium]MDA1113755.1 hypothetical protein [Planctomycetota bacterium]
MKTFSALIAALLLTVPVAAQHGEHGDHPADDVVKAKQKISVPTTLGAQTTCPISGEELEDKDNFVDYEGHRIYACCKKCVKKVTKKPEQIALAMYQDGIALENIQTLCPVSGEELEDRDTFVKVYNKTIYTCCEKCAKKVKADPSKYLDVMEGRQLQNTCAYSGEELDAEEAFMLEGFNAGACCPKCVAKAQAEPATFFAKLEEKSMVVEYASTDCLVMPGKPVNRSHFATLGSKRYFFCCEPCTMKFMENTEKFLSGEATAAGLEGEIECADCGDEKCADCTE